MVDLTSLKFIVKFDDCSRFTLSFLSTIVFFFVIGFSQCGFKLCSQKTEVVEMDEISKFRFDLNRCVGTCQSALQYENTHFEFF